MSGYIGVDFDGTLCQHFTVWRGVTHVPQEPAVPEMLRRVKAWLAVGQEVRIVTARLSCDKKDRAAAIEAIHIWLERNGLPRLVVTNEKTFAMIELWDDRAVQVERDTGIPIDNRRRNR